MKKALYRLLCALLILSLLPFSVFADDDTLVLSSADDWNTFAGRTVLDRTFDGKTVVLSDDLDFSDVEFVPVSLFSGKFYGNGHSLSGISVETEGSVLSVFRHLLPGGSVERLCVQAELIGTENSETVGGIAGRNEGTIRNCDFEGRVSGKRTVGGVCGVNEESGQIEGCSVSGFVSAEHISGGIAGENLGTLLRCVNHAEVNTSPIETELLSVDISNLSDSAEELLDITDIGGIAGLSSGSILSCRNTGAVGYSRLGYNVGGIAGHLSGMVFSCVNIGEIRGKKDVGGIVGQLDPDTAWDFSQGKLTTVKQQLDSLEWDVNQLVSDIQSTERGVSDSIQSMLDSITDLANAAQEYSQETDYFTEDELEALREDIDRFLSDREDAEFFSETEEEDYPEEENSFFLGTYTGPGYDPSVFDTDPSQELSDALQNAVDSLDNLRAMFADEKIIRDIRNVSSRLFSLSKSLMSLADGRVSPNAFDYRSDISLSEGNRQRGMITRSESRGEIIADTNAGGIVGAVSIDLSFDPEDEYNLSSMISGGAKYLIFAVVSDCINTGSVHAQKSAAGGIAGRMDYGALLRCSSCGDVCSSGEYGGGIAGLSRGTVQLCFSRSHVEAERYLGGIAGSGKDILNCLTQPNFSGSCSYMGAVAGYADGKVSENYYTACELGGVNGFSFTSQAEPISYYDLLKKSGDSQLFRTVTIKFMGEEGCVESLELPYGSEITELPSVADKDNMVWHWNSFDCHSVCESMTISGRYVSPVLSLSSGEEIPRFIVEGKFSEEQVLNVISDEDGAVTLNVPGYNDALLVRMKEERNGQVFVLSPDGEQHALDSNRDGSYLVFSIDNGGCFVFEESQEHRNLPAVIISSVGLLLLFHLLRKSKKQSVKTVDTV